MLQQVVRNGGFRVSRTVDLTHRESEDKYLEGTGSVVLDRTHRIAYACSSPRTDLDEAMRRYVAHLDERLRERPAFWQIWRDASAIFVQRG